MNRRKFASLLGLAPVAAAAAPILPEVLPTWEPGVPIFSWTSRLFISPALAGETITFRGQTFVFASNIPLEATAGVAKAIAAVINNTPGEVDVVARAEGNVVIIEPA